MSRWQAEFDQHPFQNEWKDLIDESYALAVDDQTVLTSVEELARLKRVIEYLRTAMQSIDVELVPKNIWDSFHPQSSACLLQVRSYQSSRDIAHLHAANQHLDNLLTYVRPYMIFPEAVIDVLSSSASAYRLQLESYVNAFLEKTNLNVLEIKQKNAELFETFNQIKNEKSRVDDFVTKLLDGTSTDPSIKSSINVAMVLVEQQVEEISKFHNALLIDSPSAISTKSTLLAAQADIISAHKLIQSALKETGEKITNLQAFHDSIFGKQDQDGQPIGGLKNELDERVNQLDFFERTQSTKYKTLYEKIESLLPGATSAGLAKAYEKLRRSFSQPIKNNTILFYTAIGLMPVVAVLASVESYSYPFSITIVSHPNLEAILKSMLLKIPFIAPLIWLAIFASLRRSQYERLQQEYAHKEALAKSYESYKKQLEALLVTDSEPLQKELIAKAIEAISFNASTTLDGKHKDKMPLEYALDSLGPEKVKQLFELFKGWMPNSKS